MTLVVRDPGLLTTVQDAGRVGFGALGVPTSGPMDSRSLAIANLLLGNDPGAAGLEMTLVGPTVEVTEATAIGLAGADLGGLVNERDRLTPGRSHRVDAGSTISFPGSPPSSGKGSRAYLAIPGGVDVPVVLGSRSTCLAGGFGGYQGRALAAGDQIEPRDRRRTAPPLLWPVDSAPASPLASPTIRIVASPGLEERDWQAAREQLVAATWTVAADSDRMGTRLAGQMISTPGTGEVLSHGVTRGSIQLPPSGLPIVLAADHQSTGGYPVIAVVATVDRDVTGQLAPGDQVRFELIDRATARHAFLDAEARFARLRTQLDEARRVAEEVEWAGA